jgi:hypothetical protein
LKFDPKFIDGTGTAPVAVLRFHPEADRFPMMGDEEFDLLVEDIGETGLQNPIVLHEEQILDGRNRYLACLKAGVPPKFVEFDGNDPVAFVYSVNVHRRHLTMEHKLNLVTRLLVESPERSDRAIAKLTQVHHKTVGRARAELEARGAGRHVETRVDSKGRFYPSRKGKAPVSVGSSIGLDEAEPESCVLASASGLRGGDINRYVNELLRILGVEKKRIAALPRASRAALARRFLELVDITLEDLRPIEGGVPDLEDGFRLGAHRELSDEHA